MMRFLKRLRGALGMGLTWAVAWAVIGGGVMEGIVDPDGRILDMWPQTLAIPGFVGGVLFSGMLWVSAGRRRFEELSLSRFGILGGATGAVLGALAVALGLAAGALPLWLRVAAIAAPATVLGAVSAAGTLALARRAGQRTAVSAGEPSPDERLKHGETQHRVEDGR
jgi:hypothetical protein